MAAAEAARAGARVTLIEKNRVLGKKLLITGGGRCNVTNSQPDRHRLVSKYGPNAPALHSVFARFSSADMRALLESLGVPTKEEDEGRVFPASDRAVDIRDALVRYARDAGVTIRTSSPVHRLEVNERWLQAAVLADGSRLEADAFILATGGSSRPETGSSGDAFVWLAGLGHSIRIPEPALVPMRVKEPWVARLQGLAFPDAKLTAFLDGKPLERRRGKLLFTHFGLSGPLALNMAQRVGEVALGGPVRLEVDLYPGEDGGELDRRLQSELAKNPARRIRNGLDALGPPRLLALAGELSGIDGEKKCSELSRDLRKRLAATLKGLGFGFAGLLGEDWAVVSSGGVHPREVDFSTMRSRLVDNLYLAGDLLDFERQSGGYSLQLCWSTGYLAGRAAAVAG